MAKPIKILNKMITKPVLNNKTELLATKIETWLLRAKSIRRVIPLLGCNSHRLNLAVNEFLSLNSILVQKVHDLMVALKHPKNRIRLAAASVLTPEIDQSTRWGLLTLCLPSICVCNLYLSNAISQRKQNVLFRTMPITRKLLLLLSSSRNFRLIQNGFKALMEPFKSTEKIK